MIHFDLQVQQNSIFIFIAESDETPEDSSENGAGENEETTVNCEEEPQNPECVKTGGGIFDQFFDASGSGDDSGEVRRKLISSENFTVDFCIKKFYVN